MTIDEIGYLMQAVEKVEMLKEKALKPCPFCGKDARVEEDLRFEQKPYDFPKYYVQCKGCHIRTKVGELRYAVERWNTRKGGERGQT